MPRGSSPNNTIERDREKRRSSLACFPGPSLGIPKVAIMRKINREKMKRDLFIAHLRSYLSFHFEELREHFDSVQHLLKNEEKRISDWKEKQTARLSLEERDEFYDWYGEDSSKFKDSFPNIQRNSIFITVYAELEDVLKFVCSALASKKGCFIQTYKWRGGIPEKVDSFLKNDIGVEFPPDDNLWDEIKKLRTIRNTIVHNGSWLDKKEKAYKEIINYINDEQKSIKLIKRNEQDSFYKVQLTDAFVFEVLDTLDEYLEKLLKPISEWVKAT